MHSRFFFRFRAAGLVWALAFLGVVPGVCSAREAQSAKDVVYGTVNGTKLLLDVYVPAGFTGKRPAVLLIHGGGWMGGDKSQYEAGGKALAALGYDAFAINYRLAPIFHYPAQLDDAQRAVRWIRAHADDYNVDPDRIGALGDSAGGYLVAMLGTRDTRDNSDADLAKYSSRVQCVVDLYGPTDFTNAPDAATVSKQAIQILTIFFGKTPEQAPDLYREGSPIIYVDKRSAPFLIMHGEKDPLVPVDQSKRLEQALKKAGVDATLVIMPNDGHGFVQPENRKKQYALSEEFFARYLKP